MRISLNPGNDPRGPCHQTPCLRAMRGLEVLGSAATALAPTIAYGPSKSTLVLEELELLCSIAMQGLRLGRGGTSAPRGLRFRARCRHCWVRPPGVATLRTASRDEPFASVEPSNVPGGEGGIRTPGTGLSQYDGLANRCFRPLSHLSVR